MNMLCMSEQKPYMREQVLTIQCAPDHLDAREDNLIARMLEE